MAQTIEREPRAEKVAVVDEVGARLNGSSAAILTEYRGLPVAQMEELRRALTAVGGEYKVYKNTLVLRAAKENGYDVLEPLLSGPTAIAFVRDDVSAVAKVLRDFARTNPNLVVKGGLIGTNLLDARAAAALAELPSREALLAQIAGLLAAPMQRFAGLLAAVPQKFAYGLSALIESRGGAEPVAETPAATTPTASEAPAAEAAVTEDAPATEDAAEAPAVEDATTTATEDAAEAAVTEDAAEAPAAEDATAPAAETEPTATAEAEPAEEPSAE